MGSGTVKSFYEEGIRRSFTEYGLPTTDLSGKEYTTSSNVPAAMDATNPAVSKVPVAFDEAGSTEKN